MDLTQLKKKLLYRSIYRGCKELDIILCAFAKKHLEAFDSQSAKEYEDLLNTPDGRIYKWITGTERVPEKYKTNVLSSVIELNKNKHDRASKRQ
jgi:antitoxin CptB